MAISTEGKFGLAVGLLALGGGGAVWVAPNQTEFGWGMIGVASLGAALLAINHFSEMLRPSWRLDGLRRMIALLCMIVFGIGFAASAAVYFWPRATQ